MAVLKKIITTAFTLGVVHVLAGPDHLSALVTLSANVGYMKAFWYGIRWGIGHSLGLILVGGIFIAIDSSTRSHHPTINVNSTSVDVWDTSSTGSTVFIPDKVSFATTTLVGVFMILFGAYSLYRIYRHIQEEKKLFFTQKALASADLDEDLESLEKSVEEQTHQRPSKSILLDSTSTCPDTNKLIHEHQPQETHSGTIITAKIVSDYNTTSQHHHHHNHVQGQEDEFPLVQYSHIHTQTTSQQQESMTDLLPASSHPPETINTTTTAAATTTKTTTTTTTTTHTNHHPSHVHSHTIPFGVLWNRKPLLALLLGIIHGVSGPGGVLAVIPAVQIHNVGHGFLYLGLFCITSTLVMGIFAALYGLISATLSRKCTCSWKRYPYLTTAIYIEIFSCFCSFFVGVLFIVLQATHTFDQFLG